MSITVTMPIEEYEDMKKRCAPIQFVCTCTIAHNAIQKAKSGGVRIATQPSPGTPWVLLDSFVERLEKALEEELGRS